MESTSMSMTLAAIKDFVSDLVSVFGGPQTSPLALYNRLIKHVETTDSADGLGKYITGFRVFFANYEKSLESIESMCFEIPKGTVIRYGDSPKIFIEIQKFIYKAQKDHQKDTLETIRQHLLTIFTVLDPNDKNLGALDAATPILEKMGFGGNSAESRKIQASVDKAKKAMEGFKSDKPEDAIAHLMTSGVIGDMIFGFQEGLENKTLDPNKLMSNLQNTLMNVFEQVGGDNEDGENKIDTNEIITLTQMSMANLDLSTIRDKRNKVEEVEENESQSVD